MGARRRGSARAFMCTNVNMQTENRTWVHHEADGGHRLRIGVAGVAHKRDVSVLMEKERRKNIAS